MNEAVQITGDANTNALYQAIKRDKRMHLKWKNGRRVVDEDELRTWQKTMRRPAGRPIIKMNEEESK